MLLENWNCNKIQYCDLDLLLMMRQYEEVITPKCLVVNAQSPHKWHLKECIDAWLTYWGDIHISVTYFWKHGLLSNPYSKLYITSLFLFKRATIDWKTSIDNCYIKSKWYNSLGVAAIVLSFFIDCMLFAKTTEFIDHLLIQVTHGMNYQGH